LRFSAEPFKSMQKLPTGDQKMAEKPSPDKFKSNSAMMAGFAAIWLTVGVNEASHFLVPDDESVSTFGYEIEVPEGFGAGSGGEPEVEMLVDIKPMLASASVEDGAKVFRKCQSCHTYEAGDRNGTGPNLYSIVGANIATRDHGGFELSDSLKENVEVWTYDMLNAYLENPKAVAPKGTMSFAGLRKPEDRADVIAFLMEYTENPPEVVLDPVEPAIEETAEAMSDDMGEAVDDATDSVGETTDAVEDAVETP
jgi:cytochrome c